MTTITDIDGKLKIQWLKKSWSIPDLPGGKQSYFLLVKTLVNHLAENKISDLNDCPDLKGIITTPRSWREYAPFLRGTGLAHNCSGFLQLTKEGSIFASNPTKIELAEIFQNKFKIFGEVLSILKDTPATVQEVDKELCSLFHLDWKNHANTRKRMDWLEVFELISPLGEHKWELSQKGLDALTTWQVVTPEIIGSFKEQLTEVQIKEAPTEIKSMLQRLRDDPSLHRERSKYNIWVPSPNRIDNLRIIATFASDKVTKSDFFTLIGDRFHLKQSSIDSMLPFLKASDLILEVKRGVYITTPAAKAWCKTTDDLDFIRILHCNMRFVGEMINFVKNETTRSSMYEAARKFGLNTEKARWIAGFLLEAQLLEEPRYLYLKATPLGIQFLNELPLAKESDYEQHNLMQGSQPEIFEKDFFTANNEEQIFQQLFNTARNPISENDNAGAAFEKAVAQVLSYAGFNVKRIGGSGDTDILVRWKDAEGNTITATVDAKSKSNGVVTHSDISDVALETHKDKHSASFTAVIGPKFSGDTIKTHAQKKGFALITDEELAQIVKTARFLGLDIDEIALIFQVPNGVSQFEELATARQRQMDLISLVIATLIKEQELYGGLSARDLSLLLRGTDLTPSTEELISILELLSAPEIHVLSISEENTMREYSKYTVIHETTAAYRLTSLSRAIMKGVKTAT